MIKQNQNSNWPILCYPEMQSTLHLIHMATQVIGKLKLSQPFEPHWAGVALWVTSTGLTSGPIYFKNKSFSIDINFLEHQIQILSSWGIKEMIPVASSSVAELTGKILRALNQMNIDLKISTIPAEIPNPVPFEQDLEKCIYQPKLAQSWWQALSQVHRVLQCYHALFRGISPPVGLMWGTLDLRDVRYQGIQVPITAANSDFIRKNAMDDAQVEAGWWCGNAAYPNPAFFSFTYPQPSQIENTKIKPESARWEPSLGEFLLDYEPIQKSADPDGDLLAFFNSTYLAGAERAGWDPNLVTSGFPER
ncbi:MAG: hypothetical protein JSR33_04015 [Proteobacteria bacterium]|nr:hypothetical protein [Pseudomonadota bacterium]